MRDEGEIMQAEHPESCGRQAGDKRDTKLKSCRQSIQSVLGDKRRQVGDKGKITQAEQSIQSLVGDRWETSGDKWETKAKSCRQSITSLVGDRWETSREQMGYKRRQEMGDKSKIVQAEQPESC